MDEIETQEPTTINNLDKQLALLKLTMTNGFETLRQEIARLADRLGAGLDDVRASSRENEQRIDAVEERLGKLEPFVESARQTWAIAWKILVGAGVAGLLWAVAQSGTLIP